MTVAAAPPEGARLIRWVLAYWVTMRPYLLFVSGAAGLVGLALAPDVPAWRIALAFAPLFLSYGLGQALTDTFQTDTDALSAPYRPLIRGEISIGAVRSVSLLALAACCLLLCTLSAWTMIPGALAVVGLLTYTPLKRRFWGGPSYNAAIVAMLPVIGALAGAPAAAVARDARLLWAMTSTFGSYAVFVIIGYLKDAQADRETGYDTIVVHFGPKAAIVCSVGFALLGLGASAGLVGPSLWTARSSAEGAAAIGLWAFGVAALGISHRLAWSVRRDEEAHPAIAWSVRGFLGLHLGEAAFLAPRLALFCLVQLATFELALRARPSRAQI
jgi:4-hydroxybenzoate polyprenyltransferase